MTKQVRNLRIVILRLSGLTLSQIAKHYEISTQRVRLILAKEALKTAKIYKNIVENETKTY